MPILFAEKPAAKITLDSGVRSGEAVAYCPRCKAFQTVWIDEKVLTPTGKFYQKDNLIYHDCGSAVPCRIYQDWK